MLWHCDYICTKAESSVFNTWRAEAESELETMINLAESNWKYDASSLADKDLNMKTWNKVAIIPLASDLKLLKEYLGKEAQKAVALLTNNNQDIAEQKGF